MDVKKRNIGKNYIYNVSFQLFSLLTPLIVTPYISRVLGAENIGIYGYTLSISTYFIIIGNLGFPLYGQREIAYVDSDIKTRSIRFFEILYGKIIGLGIVIFLFGILLLKWDQDIRGMLLLQGIGIIADVINIGWFYQGIEKFKLTVVRNYFIKIFSIVCVFLFVKESKDIYTYTLIINLANLIGNLLILIDLKKYIDFSCCKVQIKKVFSHFKPAFWLGIPYYISSVYTLIDKTMLGMMYSTYSEVGYYEQSQKIVNCAMAIVTAVGTVYMPRLANEVGKKNKEKTLFYLNQGIEFVLMLAMPISVGLFLLSDMIVPWFYGAGYEKVEGLLKIFSISICMSGLSNFIGNQYLVVTQKEKYLTISIAVGVGANFCMNAILIPRYASYGAAFGTLVAIVVKVLLQFYMVKEDLKVRKIAFVGIKYFGMAFIMAIVVMIFKINWLYEKTFVNTIILALIGVCSYFMQLMLINRKEIIS